MTPAIPYSARLHSLPLDDLVQGVLSMLHRDELDDAVELALLLAGTFGVLHPETHVLCASALGRAGYGRAALLHWDAAVRRRPQCAQWLSQALHAAWAQEATSASAALFARNWLLLLERIFITVPPPATLAALTQRGWQGTGAAGMHQGRLRAWLWLPEQALFHVRVSTGGPSFSLGIVQKMTLASCTLHIIDAPIPGTDSPFYIHVTDAKGRHAQGSPVPCSSPRCALPPKTSAPQKTTARSITIIVPVYGDRKATLACLAAVIASQKINATPSTVLVMWDHGPDATLLAALQRLAARRKIILRATPSNMGFLACVNQALASVPTGDVILLNADTLVSGDWIDRMASVLRRSHAGTVTALGSEAELVSFPAPHQRGTVRHMRQVRILDAACRCLSEEDAVQEIPVGVGFCMAIARRALHTLGGFDGLGLFSGYGEEVDFCLRVKEAGYKNYVAMNVFVAHLGGRSFGYAKKALVAQNNIALFQRYPHYAAGYDAFLRKDPLRGMRERISHQACRELPPDTLLHLYGWTEREHPVVQAAQNSAADHNEAWAALFVRPGGTGTRAVLRVRHDVPLADMSFLLPQDGDALRRVVSRCGFRAIAMHGASVGLHPVRAFLNLPDAHLPPVPAPSLPPLPAADRPYAADVPRTVRGWQHFCAMAGSRPASVFWVYQLARYWGDAPHPANIRELPDLEDMTPLSLAGLVFVETAEAAAVTAWQTWLHQRTRISLPLWGLPAEAA